MAHLFGHAVSDGPPENSLAGVLDGMSPANTGFRLPNFRNNAAALRSRCIALAVKRPKVALTTPLSRGCRYTVRVSIRGQTADRSDRAASLASDAW